MAPRPPESREWFLKRLAAQGSKLARQPVRFGAPHHTHAVLQQDGVFRVRTLVLDRAKADAFMRQHGRFMPENAEDLSEPTGAIVLEAPTLEGLISLLQAGPWPL